MNKNNYPTSWKITTIAFVFLNGMAKFAAKLRIGQIINLLPFCIEELQDYYDYFDIDDEIDLHRQDERYRKAFRITESVRDFTGWIESLERVICNYYSKAA